MARTPRTAARRPDPHRQQELYWRQLVELKVASSYIRVYRDQTARFVTALGVVRAVASSGAIGGWVIWRQQAFVWGCIIAASQVADALKDVFPFAQRHKAASAHLIILDSLFIDAQLEWENVFAGVLTNQQIVDRRHKLAKLQHEAEARHFPDGLPPDPRRFALAQQDAADYFKATYGV